MRFSLLIALIAPGCIWVGDKELSERQDELVDLDGDGYENEFGDNADCDDADKAVFPGATEVWYDGTDQDCAGGDDYDADGDGVATPEGGGDDCDDQSALVYPGATDAWYDGVDADCGGGSDYDQDGDGYDSDAYGDGDDCDDTNPAYNPGADDAPYDTIDHDCQGDSDFDYDQDGHDSESWGGDDCDDYDPDTYLNAPEIWYDGVDQDCAGGSDYDQDGDGHDSANHGGDDCFDEDVDRTEDWPQLGAVTPNDCGPGNGDVEFAAMDLRESEPVIGPRLDTNGSVLAVAWGYEVADESGPNAAYDGLGGILVDLDAPDAGEFDFVLFSYSVDVGDFDEVLDVAISDEEYLWASGLQNDDNLNPERQFWVDIFGLSSDTYDGYQRGEDDDYGVDYQDIQIDIDDDEHVVAIACEEEVGSVYVVDGDLSDLIADSSGIGSGGGYVTKIVDASASGCEYVQGTGEFVLASEADNTLGRYTRAGALFNEVELLTGMDVRDVEADGGALIVADAIGGLYLWDEAGEDVFPTGEIVERVDMVALDEGILACTVDAVGTPLLYHGSTTEGLLPVAVSGAFGTYDDCGVAFDGGLAFVALRSGDAIELAFGYPP